MNSALKNYAAYVNNKIDVCEISLNQYISTDNILQNKQGIECAASLPIQGGKVTAFKKGDILLANIRPYLKKIWYAQFGGGCSADVLAIRANAKIDSHFLFYALFRDDFFIHAMKGSKGTKMPRGDKTQIMEFKIPVFDPQTQQSIAAVLSALDKKIALNKQINARLEEMAKTLYDYWFVQFDFPDADGKPYKSSGGEMVFDETLKREIPKGWKPFKLSELVTLSTGKEDANFATEQGIYPFFTCSEKILKCDVYSFDTQAILLAGNGTFSVKRFTGKFNAYQRTYVLEPKSKNLYPIVYFVIIDNVIKFTSGSRGSIIKFITRGDIEHIDVVLPNDIENMRFSEVLYTYLLQAELLEKQNYQLTQLRDFLLPMLMNGQVSVAE